MEKGTGMFSLTIYPFLLLLEQLSPVDEGNNILCTLDTCLIMFRKKKTLA